MLTANKIKVNKHPFHIVDPSPWPFFVAFSLFGVLFSLVCYLHELYFNSLFLSVYIVFFFFSAANWFYDIVVEATYQGQHTLAVQQGLRYGMVLFIVSEVMFFFAFFWAFFYSAVSPTIAIGCVWPPIGIEPLNAWGLPFLNTLILLSSGVSVTWAHRAIAYKVGSDADYSEIDWVKLVEVPGLTADQKRFIVEKRFLTASTETILSVIRPILQQINFGVEDENLPLSAEFVNYRKQGIIALFITIIFGLLFTALQLFEYQMAPFTLADGIYGSTFFVTTGFHGLHVIVGTIFLIVCLCRHIYYHFLQNQHFGLEAGIWYWHFVDVVWLLLFVSIYWWGS